eukprot:comp20036_c1_seq1/m.24596 comp20036_c1_seq1/g.24596  ORF comp20036_c1_seq1/g.24596 comp20036_c1_seq1/m.24596 type:complete len:275 (-) comp20036_c1_seq1:416-1240(-)
MVLLPRSFCIQVFFLSHTHVHKMLSDLPPPDSSPRTPKRASGFEYTTDSNTSISLHNREPNIAKPNLPLHTNGYMMQIQHNETNVPLRSFNEDPPIEKENIAPTWSLPSDLFATLSLPPKLFNTYTNGMCSNMVLQTDAEKTVRKAFDLIYKLPDSGPEIATADAMLNLVARAGPMITTPYGSTIPASKGTLSLTGMCEGKKHVSTKAKNRIVENASEYWNRPGNQHLKLLDVCKYIGGLYDIPASTLKKWVMQARLNGGVVPGRKGGKGMRCS